MTEPIERDVEARLARYAQSDDLNDAEVAAVRAGRCGPLLHGGPCWLMPRHAGPHHCYRDDVDALLAAAEARAEEAEAERDEARARWDRVCMVEPNLIGRTQVAEARAETLARQVAAVEALADEWADRGNAVGPAIVLRAKLRFVLDSAADPDTHTPTRRPTP